MAQPIIKDSGTRQVYDTGANRDNAVGKGRMDLLPPEAILRLSRWYEAGANKYGDHNWQKGMPISRYLDAGLRHLFKYLAGCDDEDHLSAVVWNILAVMHHEEHDPHLQDVLSWKGKVSSYLYDLDYGNKPE